MTDYRTITETETDPYQPPTTDLFKALAKNPVAIAEGAPGAPWSYGAWHPFDSEKVGDGADGLLWDYATDGAISAITSPPLESWYAYRLIGIDLAPSVNALQSMSHQMLTTSWLTVTTTAMVNNMLPNGYRHQFDCDFGPSITGTQARRVKATGFNSSQQTITVADTNISSARGVAISQVRTVCTGTLVSGKVFLFKRRVREGMEA